MKRNTVLTLLCPVILAACSVNYNDYVDPMIGTGEHGHVFVGANVPYGMVQLGPFSVSVGWDWCSGYHVSDSSCLGFAHTRVSGTGICDLFDVSLMPVVGNVVYGRGRLDDMASGMWSPADRTREVAVPGYYSVPLTRYGILAEMTATERTGIQRYTFPQSDSSAVVFDMENGGGFDRATEWKIESVGDREVRGWRFSSGWAKNQKMFFHAEFSRPFDTFEVIGDGKYARAGFKTVRGEKVLVKVGLSPTGTDAAKANLAAEQPGWDFEKVRRDAASAWERELSKIRVKTSDRRTLRIFYTAMYHALMHPSLFNDADGAYRGADDKIHPDPGHATYTVYSLWDTYRAEMPLLSILDPGRVGEMTANMLDIFDEQGKLPIWHLMANENNTMAGHAGIIVVSDAVVKGLGGFDHKRALEAAKASAMNPERGQGARMALGYTPMEAIGASVAHDMENAVADAALANMAGVLGDAGAEKYFRQRSHSWMNYFDPKTLFIRGRYSDGSFVEPFNPYESNHGNSAYMEGNAWQYTWLVPHDLDSLERLYGSRERMLERLDTLFLADERVDGEHASPDITGLIGQYVHGNEPSHHIIYMYTMAGEPRKAAEKVRQVLSGLYTDGPDGIAGNEDCGEISAWYILSSLGFYQAEPASKRFWFGSPIFDSAEIDVPGGVFRVIAKGNGPDAPYIESVKLNGEPYDRLWIDYDDIMKGGTLEFTMGR